MVDLNKIHIKTSNLSNEQLNLLLKKCLSHDLERMAITDINAIKIGSLKITTDEYFDYERARKLIIDDNNSQNAYAACNMFEDEELWEIDNILLDHFSDLYGEKLSLQCSYFYRYTEGGFLRSHSDNSIMDNGEWIKTEPFDYTGLLYLNDDFTGGEFVIDELNLSIQPFKNLLLAIPSDCLHSVKPITSGIRCAYSMKMCGNGVVGLRSKFENERKSN